MATVSRPPVVLEALPRGQPLLRRTLSLQIPLLFDSSSTVTYARYDAPLYQQLIGSPTTQFSFLSSSQVSCATLESPGDWGQAETEREGYGIWGVQGPSGKKCNEEYVTVSCGFFSQLQQFLVDGRKRTWRRGSGSNRRIKVLQTFALPLGYRAEVECTSAK